MCVCVAAFVYDTKGGAEGEVWYSKPTLVNVYDLVWKWTDIMSFFLCGS